MPEDDGTMTQAEREAQPGFEDEVAKKRTGKGAAKNGAAAEPPAEPPADPGTPLGDANGETLEDRVNGSGTKEEEDGQIGFVWEHGRKVSFGNLIARKTPVEYRVKFGGISVKGKGEPVPLEAKDMLLIGRYHSGGMNFVPSHDEEGNVTKVTVYATLKPQGAPVDVSTTQGRHIIGTPSIADAVAALVEDGVTPDYIRGEVEKALTAASV